MYFKTRKEARIYQHITGMKWWTGATDWESNAEVMFLGHKHENMTRRYIDCIQRHVDRSSEQYYKEQKSLASEWKEGSGKKTCGIWGLRSGRIRYR